MEAFGDFLAGQLAHQGLELEDGLQRSLGNFRLIGRVGSQKFAALNNGVRDYRAQMVVDAGAQKTGVAERIFGRALLEIFYNFGFGKRPGQVQRFFQPVCFGNAREKLFDSFCAGDGKHFLAFSGALGEIAHQAEASFSFSATKAS